MTPDTLAKANTEHSHQRALFAWANVAARFGFEAAWDDRCYTIPKCALELSCNPLTRDRYQPIPALARLHAIPNGGYRDKITAGKLKAEGVKTGVPDIFLPVPTFLRTQPTQARVVLYCGLYVELKRPKTLKAGTRKALIVDQAEGQTSAEQDDWIAYLRQAGYAVSVCFDWRSAAKDIQKYIEGALMSS